jgi:putative transposase
LHHKTPSWVKSGALFHIRVRTTAEQYTALTNSHLVRELLAAARCYHSLHHWWCQLFLVMPDHVHAMLVFPRESGMSATVCNWKRGTARLHRVRWQENYFDHRIRNGKERDETWNYIRRNPVVKGLCAMEEDWPHWWCAQSEAE